MELKSDYYRMNGKFAEVYNALTNMGLRHQNSEDCYSFVNYAHAGYGNVYINLLRKTFIETNGASNLDFPFEVWNLPSGVYDMDGDPASVYDQLIAAGFKHGYNYSRELFIQQATKSTLRGVCVKVKLKTFIGIVLKFDDFPKFPVAKKVEADMPKEKSSFAVKVNPVTSDAMQQFAFNNGWEWAYDARIKHPVHTNKPYLYFSYHPLGYKKISAPDGVLPSDLVQFEDALVMIKDVQIEMELAEGCSVTVTSYGIEINGKLVSFKRFDDLVNAVKDVRGD